MREVLYEVFVFSTGVHHVHLYRPEPRATYGTVNNREVTCHQQTHLNAMWHWGLFNTRWQYTIDHPLFSQVNSRTETNTQFAHLHNYSNTMKVFEYTANDFGVVILAYLVNIYIFKTILAIQRNTFYVFLA